MLPGHHERGKEEGKSPYGWASILKITMAFRADFARDADGGAAVGDAPGELVDGAGLVATCKTLVVVLAFIS